MGKLISRLRKRRKKNRKHGPMFSSDPNLTSSTSEDRGASSSHYSRRAKQQTGRGKDKLGRTYKSEPNISTIEDSDDDDIETEVKTLQHSLQNETETKIAEYDSTVNEEEKETNEDTPQNEEDNTTSDDDSIEEEKEQAKHEMIGTDKILAAAIDIGSSFSGYAFCLKEVFLKDRFSIYCPNWSAGDAMRHKTPSSILFKPDGSFFKFGHEAEALYTQKKDTKRVDSSSLSTWFYFQHFKMILYDKKDEISNDMNIQDIQGKTMKAIDVFSAAIKFLKDHLLNTLTKTYGTQSSFNNDDIQWVITVPAIWNMRGKQFMRDAAIKAGIEGEQLILALEPEAASLFCKQAPILTNASDSTVKANGFEEGSSYIVLDQGGGTIDICVHQILPDNCLKEIYQATGGDWGGNLVNKKFIEYLTGHLGEQVMEQVNHLHPSDYAEIINEFEIKKRCFDVNSELEETQVIIKIPPSLPEAYEQLNGANSIDSVNVTIERGKICIPTEDFKKWFQESLDKTTSHIKWILAALSDVKTILAVGGFSESSLVFDKIRTTFPDINVIVPKDAGLAVLKGAVVFAFHPSLIKIRISRFTYGIKVEKRISANSKKKYTKTREDQSSGKTYAVDVFEKLVTIGDKITVGELQPKQEYDLEHDMNQNHARMKFYATTKANPVHVTDEGCIEIGTLIIDISERGRSGGSVSLQIDAGGTEISAFVTDNETGKKFQGHFCIP